MLVEILRGKIHRACVTQADLNYEGSITIDQSLLDASGILPNEKVHVLNLSNGTRAETYVISGPKNNGDIIMNGAIARWTQLGDRIIILSYGLIEEEEAKKFQPKIVVVDEKNRIIRKH